MFVLSQRLTKIRSSVGEGFSTGKKRDIHGICASHPRLSEVEANSSVDQRKHGMEMVCFLHYIWGKAGVSARRGNDLEQVGLKGGWKQDKRFACKVFESY
nr:hypothetical protein [Paraburkholderia elongata]